MECHAKNDNVAVQKVLGFYINCRKKDIERSNVNIAKEKLRIQKNKEFIEVASSLLIDLNRM